MNLRIYNLLQVMLQIMGMCTVMGEPLSQTAQSFMPELIYGVNRSLEKVCSSAIVFSALATAFSKIQLVFLHCDEHGTSLPPLLSLWNDHVS